MSLELDEYRRYGRQMILDGFSLSGQLKLRDASVVVVGAGGLGCPALQYLAASGLGRIGIVDHDTVEISNLQRQVLHTEATIGLPKAESAAQALKRLNSHVVVDVMTEALTPQNAVSLLSSYDIILDCTDNAPTRYLLSDTAVALGKPLVSGAAQKFEGQLCTYNLGDNGPCYRCLFPKPPAPDMVGTCEETGILGAVTGIIGSLQALEAIKIITGLHEGKPSLLLYSSLRTPPFKSITLRSKKLSCPACGQEGQTIGRIDTIDYVQLCGGKSPDWESRGLVVGDFQSRVDVKEFKHILDDPAIDARIIDVRPVAEYGICNLPGSINVSLKTLVAQPADYLPSEPSSHIYVVCRLGNDSQIAAAALRTVSQDKAIVKDVIGGLCAWSKQIDPMFPIY